MNLIADMFLTYIVAILMIVAILILDESGRA